MLFSESALLPCPHTPVLVPPTPPSGTLVFRCFLLGCVISPMVSLCEHFGTQSGAKDAPRCAKSAKKEPKSSLLGAQSVTFRCQIGESGPLQKHQYLLWFSHIIRVRAPPFSHSKSTRERNVHQRRSFSLFYAHFWRQSDAQGRPKAGPREPKGPKRSPKAFPGTPKNH